MLFVLGLGKGKRKKKFIVVTEFHLDKNIIKNYLNTQTNDGCRERGFNCRQVAIVSLVQDVHYSVFQAVLG